MPLNLSINDGEITPFLKYNAKAGRFYARVQGVDGEIEVDRPRLAFDMENIKTGWIFYQEGAGPEKVWDPSRTQMAARPLGPRKFKRGFEVMVFGNDDIPGIGRLGLREFGSTATNVITSILQMFDEYEKGARANPGNVPFFACTGVKAIAGSYGTNYEPRFVLKSWIPRGKIPAFDEVERAAPVNNGRGHAPDDDTGFGNYAPPPADVPRGRDDLNDDIPF